MINNNKRQHLRFILKVIGRMNRNSFFYRLVAVTIFLVIFSLLIHSPLASNAFLSIFPIIGCWCSDAYYLRQERLFRKLYDKVRLNSDSSDFSMNTDGFVKKVDSVKKIMLSKSILWLYIPIIVIIIIKCI